MTPSHARPDAARRHPTWSESAALMGTVVTVRLVGQASPAAMHADIARALSAMRGVELACTRFDAESPANRLGRTPGRWVEVPSALYRALQIAVEMANLTEGRFDPAVGARLEALGFNRHYLTGEVVAVGAAADPAATYRDIHFDPDGPRVWLDRPMVIDLGAVAKGLAVDVAARELRHHDGVAIDAGGDVWAAGMDPDGLAWRVGIESPNSPAVLMGVVEARDTAVCTSGGSKRPSPVDGRTHHLIDPGTGQSPDGLLACTVLAPQAVLADVAATAAYLLGPDRALPFLEDLGLAAVVVTSDHRILQTDSLTNFERPVRKGGAPW
jgi:thiamine biosynthesis lipoprotein